MVGINFTMNKELKGFKTRWECRDESEFAPIPASPLSLEEVARAVYLVVKKLEKLEKEIKQ